MVVLFVTVDETVCSPYNTININFTDQMTLTVPGADKFEFSSVRCEIQVNSVPGNSWIGCYPLAGELPHQCHCEQAEGRYCNRIRLRTSDSVTYFCNSNNSAKYLYNPRESSLNYDFLSTSYEEGHSSIIKCIGRFCNS